MSVYPNLLQPTVLSPDIALLTQDKSGQLAINPNKGFAKFFYLRALGNNGSFTQNLAANGTAVLNITAPAEENLRGDFEICDLLSTSTGRFSTQIFQNTINRNFQNTPVPNNLLYGTASFPGSPVETMYLQTTTSLQLTITDLSGLPNSVQIVARGRRFLDWGNERMGDVRRRDFYARRTHPYFLLDNRGAEYSITTGGGTATLILNVPQDADFNCVGLVDDSDGDYSMQIFEGLSSRALMDAQISAQSFVTASTWSPKLMRASGVAGLGGGRMIGWSHLFKRSSQININITDLSNVPNRIRLALVGQLVYYQAPSGEMLTNPASTSGADSPLMQAAPLQGYGAQTGPLLPMGLRPGTQRGPVQQGMGYLDARLFKRGR